MATPNNIQDLNNTIKAARESFKNGVKSPIKLMNIMNGQAFKNDPALKAALHALGASRWTLDLAPHTLTGAICKIGKAVPSGVDDADTFENDGKAYTWIAGKLYYAQTLESFRGEDFLTICKAKKVLELKRQNAEKAAADKEAKKAQKAAQKKADEKATLLRELIAQGIIPESAADALAISA